MGREERLEGRRGRRLAQRHRRLRQDHVRGSRPGRVLAAEVRGRSASRAACAEDRGPGTHPHLGGDCRGAAGGGPGGGRAAAGRPGDQGLDLDRPRRAERQHDLFSHPHHAQADRPGGEHPGREIAAAEQGEGDAHPSRSSLRDEARRAAGGDRRAAARHGSQRKPLGEDPDLQLQRQPRHRPPDQPDAAQARPRHAG